MKNKQVEEWNLLPLKEQEKILEELKKDISNTLEELQVKYGTNKRDRRTIKQDKRIK